MTNITEADHDAVDWLYEMGVIAPHHLRLANEAFSRHREQTERQAADRIEQLEREKAVVSDLWEQQKEIALDYLADCNKAADRIEALEAENERLEERLGEAYQIAGHIAAEYDGNGQIERLLDLLAGVNLGEKG